MKHEHEINVPFTINRGQTNEIRCKAIQATDGCTGCLFRKRYYDYSCGYGFPRTRCLAEGPRFSKCTPENRSDGKAIIYVKVKVENKS